MKSTEYTLQSRISWVVWSRVVFLAVLTTSAWSSEAFYSESIPSDFYHFVWLGLGFSLLSLFLNKVIRHPIGCHSIAWLQVVVDSFLVSYIVFKTGNSESAFFILYGLSILTSGVVMFSRGVVASSFLATIGYVWVVMLESGGLAWPEGSVLARLVIQVSSLLLAGGVIAWLFQNRSRLIRSLQKTEKDLQDLNTLQAAIVDHIPAGILMVQFDGSIIFANRMAREILGGEPTGRDLSELSEEFFSGSPHIQELQIRSLESEDKVLRVESLELNSAVRIVLFEDVTEQRSLEEQLRFRERLASVGQLAAGLAHEIKNPLASLSGSIQILQSEMSPEASSRRLMDIVIRETDRLDELLQSFLNYAKPSELKETEIDLIAIAREVLEIFQKKAGSKKIDWRIESPDSLWIQVDENKIRQVFWNLFSNAEESIESEGEVKVSLRLTEEESLWIEIEDSGCGMTPETQKKIFEPFFSSKSKGTGLGLALVYQIIDAHGGQMGVESELGRGSRFWIKFKKKRKLESFGAGEAA